MKSDAPRTIRNPVTRAARQPATRTPSTRTASTRTASTRRTRRAGKPVKSGTRGELIDHSRGGNTWLEFPEMKGRVVEKIEFYSSTDYNTLAVIFADQTSLDLEIVTTGFEIRADLERRSRAGNYGVVKRWPAIRSEG